MNYVILDGIRIEIVSYSQSEYELSHHLSKDDARRAIEKCIHRTISNLYCDPDNPKIWRIMK